MRAKPNSIGKRTAFPMAMSVPPPSRNFANASTPSPPMPPVMSGDLAVHPEELVLRVLHVRHGPGRGRLIDRLAVGLLRRHQDDVVVVAQVALLDPLLVDEVERDPELVEGEPLPAELLRAGPLRVDRDPRHVGVVHRHRRQRRSAPRRSGRTSRPRRARPPDPRAAAMTNEPAGNSMPSAVKLFSAIFIGTFRSA